ncbi:MAG: hypothetical protein LC118_11280 [Dehalococcoidia bacterium]|nr:hypothetical protein [Dehalococcoidia bacterium]
MLDVSYEEHRPSIANAVGDEPDEKEGQEKAGENGEVWLEAEVGDVFSIQFAELVQTHRVTIPCTRRVESHARSVDSGSRAMLSAAQDLLPALAIVV